MAEGRKAGGMTAAQVVDIPPIWLVAALGLVWAQAKLLPELTLPFQLSQFAGALLVTLGVALILWAVAAFRVYKTSVVPHRVPEVIITTGPFRRSRNPIYLGDVMVLVGATLWLGAWPSLLLIPLFMYILTRRFIAPEEARMKQSFGPDFTAFAQKTPRWL